MNVGSQNARLGLTDLKDRFMIESIFPIDRDRCRGDEDIAFSSGARREYGGTIVVRNGSQALCQESLCLETSSGCMIRRTAGRSANLDFSVRWAPTFHRWSLRSFRELACLQLLMAWASAFFVPRIRKGLLSCLCGSAALTSCQILGKP